VAFSGSFWCTHEQCSRYWRIRHVRVYARLFQRFLKERFGVRGVQAATTRRLSLCSAIAARIAFWNPAAHENMSSPANFTPGSFFTYSTTDGTSTTEAMLMPQRHT